MSKACPQWSSDPVSMLLQSLHHSTDKPGHVMENDRFKVIEKPSVEQVVAIAAKLIERGYKPVADIIQMPNTGLFTQVMHWQQQYRK